MASESRDGEAEQDGRTVMSLGAMKPGMRGIVLAFDESAATTSPGTEERLREMGFAENLELELTHQSPFGKDPIAVRVGSMSVALRRHEASVVKVKLL